MYIMKKAKIMIIINVVMFGLWKKAMEGRYALPIMPSNESH